MFVKHLQEYLDQFTDGKKGNAVSNATIYMEVNGHLEEVKRIEVTNENIDNYMPLLKMYDRADILNDLV